MRFLFKQLFDQVVFIKHTLPQLYFIRWWRSVINNLENLVNWLQRRLIDEYFNQDALDLTFQVNNFMATANRDLKKMPLNERSNYIIALFRCHRAV